MWRAEEAAAAIHIVGGFRNLDDGGDDLVSAGSTLLAAFRMRAKILRSKYSVGFDERIPYHFVAVRRLQIRLPAIHFRSTPAYRKRLLIQCWDALSASANLSEVEDLEYMRRTFGRWFLGASFDDIYRENWQIWAAWVFFDADWAGLG